MRFQYLPRIFILIALITPAPDAFAQADPMTPVHQAIQDLQKQMLVMQQTIESQNHRISELEHRPSIRIPGSEAAGTVSSDTEFNERVSQALGGSDKWLKGLSFKGDLRLRYDGMQNTSGDPAEADDRNRFRYRLRFGFEKQFSEEMKAGFGLASGENVSGSQVDPTAVNTTFDNLFNFKDVYIEKAYATYLPNWAKIGPVSRFEVTAGKFWNPFERGASDLVWDRDLKPEGIYESVDFGIFENPDLKLNGYATAGQFVLNESASSGGDAELFAQQLGFITEFPGLLFDKPLGIHSAVSYYSFLDYAQSSNFMIGTTSLARGNPNASGNPLELDTGDFEVLEIYNELQLDTFGLPFRPFIDWAVNLDNACVSGECITSPGTNENNAYALGTKIGKLDKKYSWELSYTYKRVEANSIMGAFFDSDFGNIGHADRRGSVIKASYALTDNLQLNLSGYLVNNLNTGTAGIRDEEQRRLQSDLVWKFA